MDTKSDEKKSSDFQYCPFCGQKIEGGYLCSACNEKGSRRRRKEWILLITSIAIFVLALLVIIINFRNTGSYSIESISLALLLMGLGLVLYHLGTRNMMSPMQMFSLAIRMEKKSPSNDKVRMERTEKEKTAKIVHYCPYCGDPASTVDLICPECMGRRK